MQACPMDGWMESSVILQERRKSYTMYHRYKHIMYKYKIYYTI